MPLTSCVYRTPAIETPASVSVEQMQLEQVYQAC